MSAHLTKLAFVHDQNDIRTLHGRKPVGDDYRGASVDHTLERRADQEFRIGVDARGSFVEDEYLRIVGKRAGEVD